MEKDKIFQLFILLIFFFNFSFQKDFDLQKDIIYKYYSSKYLEESTYQNFDEFYEGNLNNNISSVEYNYTFDVKKENTEQIFIDYQSEYGCLKISSNYKKSIEFCAKDKNNFFILNTSDFINENEGNLTLNIKIEYNFVSEFNFDYSLKVSLKRPINILKINSEHKMLCQMEEFENEKYRCLFMIVNMEKNNDIQNNLSLIIFPLLNENSEEIDIYVDYINDKSIYDEFNKTALNNSIPNENSEYKNKINETRLNFVRITNLNTSQYIYIKVESKKPILLEIAAQKFSENETSYSFSKNSSKFQIYSINKNLTNFYLDFNQSEISTNLFLIHAIQGKSTLQIGDDTSTNYIIDERESDLFLYLDYNKCSDKNCNFTFFNLDDNVTFYISYFKRENYKINELIHGKSSRLSFDGITNHILLYEHIPPTNNISSININLQLYKFKENQDTNYIFKTEAILLSQETLNKIKNNETVINELQNKTERQLNSLISATNIYLEDYIYENNSYLLIIITPLFDCSSTPIILGTSISLNNSLIYPAERIYHFGEMNRNMKVTYKLEGKKKYHLMRLEFGKNSEDISWSVNRNYGESNYQTNDSDISFVVEYWINGRTLLTMYIEKGEDIYLTIFRTSLLQRNMKINYVFKYINSAKNGDFKNYRVKDDLLYYDMETKKIKINNLKISSKNLVMNYYMRIIQKDDYIEEENLKSISLIESNSSFLTKMTFHENETYYDVTNVMNKHNSYIANCYITVIENNNDMELLAYNYSTIIPEEPSRPSKGLAIASIVIAGIALISFVSRLIHHFTCAD